MVRRRTGGLAFSLFSFQDIITSVTGIMILITLILALELLNRVEASPTAQTSHDYNDVKQVIQQLAKEVGAIQGRLEAARVSLEDLPVLDAIELTRLTDNLQKDSEKIQSQIVSATSRSKSKQRQLGNVKEKLAKNNMGIQERYQQLKKEIEENAARLLKIRKGNHISYKKTANKKTMWLVEITADGFHVAPLERSTIPVFYDAVVDLAKWAKSNLSTTADEFLLIVKPGGEENYRQCLTQLGKSGSKSRAGLNFSIAFDLVLGDQQVLDVETGASGS